MMLFLQPLCFFSHFFHSETEAVEVNRDKLIELLSPKNPVSNSGLLTSHLNSPNSQILTNRFSVNEDILVTTCIPILKCTMLSIKVCMDISYRGLKLKNSWEIRSSTFLYWGHSRVYIQETWEACASSSVSPQPIRISLICCMHWL